MIKKLETIKKGIIIEDNIYHVIPFEGYKSHFIGINNENNIALLLKTVNSSCFSLAVIPSSISTNFALPLTSETIGQVRGSHLATTSPAFTLEFVAKLITAPYGTL